MYLDLSGCNAILVSFDRCCLLSFPPRSLPLCDPLSLSLLPPYRPSSARTGRLIRRTPNHRRSLRRRCRSSSPNLTSANDHPRRLGCPSTIHQLVKKRWAGPQATCCLEGGRHRRLLRLRLAANGRRWQRRHARAATTLARRAPTLSALWRQERRDGSCSDRTAHKCN